MKNIEITKGELYNWDCDNESNVFPEVYMIWFKFHNEEIMSAFSTKGLKKYKENEYLTDCYAETKSDLLSSFEDKLEDDEVANYICQYCEEIWKKDNDNVGIYNYLGSKIK